MTLLSTDKTFIIYCSICKKPLPITMSYNYECGFCGKIFCSVHMLNITEPVIRDGIVVSRITKDKICNDCYNKFRKTK